MSAKVGDYVRFLNSTGGGRVVRIEGQIAYVDEDGFETPVMLRECVTVQTGDSFYRVEGRRKPEAAEAVEAVEAAKPEPVSVAKTTLPPVEETPEGEKLNVVIGFEPANIKQLNKTNFDCFLVNDSNYTLYVVVSTRGELEDEWNVRFAGEIDAAVQEFLFELKNEELANFSQISVQGIAFKKGKEFGRKQTIDYQRKIDATKFAKLHCFSENEYFEDKVLGMWVVKNDEVCVVKKIEGDKIRQSIEDNKNRENVNKDKVGRDDRKQSKSSKAKGEIVEIDLHAGELLDSLSGLSKADILNYQIDTFRKVMDENLKFPERKIVFIHGKGEGVLRNALLKELNYRYKGHDVADASFREYGFGATQVTIRKVK